MLIALILSALATPIELSHQGRAIDATGVPLEGVHSVQLTLSSDPAANDVVWSTSADLDFASGHYAVQLGGDGSLDSSVFDGRTLYLSLGIDTFDLGAPQAIATVPYAVHSQSVTGRVQVGDAGSSCTSPADDGLMRFVDNSLYVCAGNEWRELTNPELGSEANPATSCAGLLAERPGASSGAYWIDPDGAGGFRAWCDMNGGWTLVLKVQSSDQTTFAYNSAEWTATTALNADSLDPSLDANMRSLAYSRLPVSEMRLDLVTQGNSIIESISGTSARALLTGSAQSRSTSRTTYLSWLSNVANSSWNNQLYCNVRGFNVSTSGPSNCRYGIIMNNENNCDSSDSAIGFGCRTNGSTTDRSTASGGHTWDPTAEYARAGWIWVR